ncbi:MAG: ArsR family transcriptional regulator, partial [Deltaproteobacteria bacterium]|nr:ArsR family transcriptional regulator [Deltaproteobacteria bacterium]
MVKVTRKGEEIRQFLLNNIEEHPKNIVHFTSNKFNISRQAVNKHIKLLITQNAIISNGTTNNRIYSLSILQLQDKIYDLKG